MAAYTEEQVKAIRADAYAEGYMDRDQGAMTVEQVKAIKAAAFAAGIAEGRRLEAADAVKHMEVA